MAVNGVTMIGRGARIRGRISGDGDLEVQGFVEGDIAVTGDVTVDADGMVGANVSGRRLVIRGAIRGDLIGEEAVVLEGGARVVGDIRAPRVTIAEGALVRGHVQTADEIVTPVLARAQSASRQAPQATGARLAPPPAFVLPAAPRASATVLTRAAAKPDASPASIDRDAGGSKSPPKRQPPPPIVPALKKLKGQILKKKER